MVAKVVLVVARARNGVIGRDNALPWHLPEDLAHFKRITMGKPIVMGRRTWESIGRPLPGRRNVVVTRDPHWRADGAEPVASLAEALRRCADAAEICVIGGARLFEEAVAVADAAVVTEIDADVAGDTFLPPFDPSRWTESAREPQGPGGPDRLPYAFVHYARRIDPTGRHS